MEITVPELPLNVLAVKDARIVVKVSVPNRPPVHGILPAEKLIENLAVIERNFKIERRSRYAPQQHQAVYASIVATVTDHVLTEETSVAIAVAAVWAALNHPRERNEMRKALGSYLTANKKGFVNFEAFPDGRVAIAVDQAPVSDETMERAAGESEEMNKEGAAATAKATH